MSFEEVTNHCLNDDWPIVKQMFKLDENLMRSFVAYAMCDTTFILRMTWRRNLQTLNYLSSLASESAVDTSLMTLILLSYGLESKQPNGRKAIEELESIKSSLRRSKL